MERCIKKIKACIASIEQSPAVHDTVWLIDDGTNQTVVEALYEVLHEMTRDEPAGAGKEE